MQCARCISKKELLKVCLQGKLSRGRMWRIDVRGVSCSMSTVVLTKALGRGLSYAPLKLSSEVSPSPASGSQRTIAASSVPDSDRIFSSVSPGPGAPLELTHVRFPIRPSHWPHPAPRLGVHASLHTSLRAGSYSDAYHLAGGAISTGVRLRTTTLEAVVRSLCSTDDIQKTTAVHPLKKHAGVPKLRPENFCHPGTRAAYELLTLARSYQQPRTWPMYYDICSSCIRRGEVVNSALLYALLAQDWAVYSALKKSTQTVSTRRSADIVAQSPIEHKIGLEMAKNDSLPQSPNRAVLPPYPTKQLLGMITADISLALKRDPTSSGEETYLREPLQALAILESLVSDGHMPFGQLSAIFSTMYRCPKVAQQVWVTRNRRPRLVKAYSYFHTSLLRIIRSFEGKVALSLPPLDTRSYNTLLYYTLNHRRSPALASLVLDHMCGRPGRNLRPSIETFNILTRSGTVIGRLDISDAALHALQSARSRTANRAVTPVTTDENVIKSIQAPNPTRVSEKNPRNPSQKDLTFPLVLSFPGMAPPADTFTLSSYITYLTSSGKAHLVADALLYALPELGGVDHPTWDGLLKGDRDELLKQSRQMRLKRAVSLGPHFYATMLDTLCKAGRTGLAERMWILASQAQKASWIPGFAPGVEPWVLSIHAYTSILQCYLYEVTRLKRPALANSDDGDWVPKADHHLRGWARFVYQRQQMERSPRGITAEKLRTLRFRSMLSGAEWVYWTLRDVRSAPELTVLALAPPAPDALFFSIALRLFSLRPATEDVKGERRKRDRTRSTPTRWTPMVQKVAEAMVSAGYALPADLRPLFKGRWEPGTRDFSPPPTLDRSPFVH